MQIILKVEKVSVIRIDAQPHNDRRVSVIYNKEARWWGGENSSIVCQLQKSRFGIIKTTLVSNSYQDPDGVHHNVNIDNT